jgi:uncharacterized protein (DUF2062 family)
MTMADAPRICVVVPVYNHALTVGRVVREARASFPVIAVNDGSTDETGRVLAELPEINVITLPQNQGKGAALQAGFAEAAKRGFTHAITIDADGQHSTAALPEFAAACRLHPEVLITGARDLVKEGASWPRRFTNDLSTFWFKVETGVPLTDTQCGYRCYPLGSVNRLCVKARRYAYELEVLVKAAWAGIPLLARPVSADYTAPTSRLSHFNPWSDMMQMSRLHSWLCMQVFCVPALLRKLSATGQLRDLPRGKRVRTILRHVFSEHTETPECLASAVGLGLFCGIAPIWGFQIITAAALAHKLRLNKAIAVTASHVSFPLAAPFILAAGLVLGHYLWTGGLIDFRPDAVARQIPLYFAEWFFGSIVLAILAGVAGTLATFLIARALARGTGPRHD